MDQKEYDLEQSKAELNNLVDLLAEQTDEVSCKAIVEKAESIYERYPESEDIALRYAISLVHLAFVQVDESSRYTTAKEVRGLYEKYPESQKVTLRYAISLVHLAFVQVDESSLYTTAKEVQGLYERYPASAEIAFHYARILINVLLVQIEESSHHIVVKQVQDVYSTHPLFVLKKFDKIFFDTKSICNSYDYKLFNFILKEGLLRNTKYAILQTWAKRYKEDSDELKNLLSIYQYVQKIKYQLGLKDKSKKKNFKFGHYTKGSVLQSLLYQKEESNFSIAGKTRLNNANYMNDPEEGIVIEKILGLDRRDVLEPSSWFLMSFTSKTDDLAMWSQYGDDAQGVCIVLREDDFSRFTSFNDVSWRQEVISFDFSNKIDSTISELNSDLKISILQTESEKDDSVETVCDEETKLQSERQDDVVKEHIDYLYRIAYVNDSGGRFSIEKTELFDDKEIIELETLLKSLKEKIDQDLNKGDDFYQKAISDCVEEIRYLFKSVDYKYEDELRILRYANLDPTNEEIKIDKSSGIGKLYVERDNPLQIAEVIFGPKFANPEYVTPLLKLLDKDIAFKKSTIKFR